MDEATVLALYQHLTEQGVSDADARAAIKKRMTGGAAAVESAPPVPQAAAQAPAPAPVPAFSAPVRIAGMLGSGAAQGLASVAGLPRAIEDHVPAADWIARGTAGLPRMFNGGTSLFPSVGDIENGLTGPLTDPRMQPANETERLAYGAAKGLGGSLPMLATGGAALPLLAGGAAGGVASQGVQDAAPNAPWWVPALAGAAAGGGLQGVMSRFGRMSTEQLAGRLGQSQTLQAAGEHAQAAAEQWTQALPTRLQSAWAPVDAAVSPHEIMEIPNFEQTVRQLANRTGPLQSYSNMIQSPLVTRLRNQIENDTSGGTRPLLATFSDVQNFRQEIGEGLNDANVLRTIPQQKLRALYGAVTRDMEVPAGQAGVGAEFTAANAESRRLFDFADRHIDPIQNAKTPEAAATRLLNTTKQGGTTLDELRTELPTVPGELAAGMLHERPDHWLKLASPEGRAALVPEALHDALDTHLAGAQGIGAHDYARTVLGALAGHGAGASLHSLAGAEVGRSMAGILGQLGGATMGDMLPAVTDFGTLAGMGIPLAYGAGRALVRNPASLALPAAGGMGGLGALGGR